MRGVYRKPKKFIAWIQQEKKEFAAILERLEEDENMAKFELAIVEASKAGKLKIYIDNK